jgi:hypothetical protein
LKKQNKKNDGEYVWFNFWKKALSNINAWSWYDFYEEILLNCCIFLDNAGKTSILYRLRLKEPITTIPTVGFNVETVLLGHVKFNVWDVGGQVSINSWKN